MKNSYLVLLLILYLVVRIIKLNLLPIFADEAIYLRWAQMIHYDPQQYLFLPLYDGKTPLFIWLLVPVTRIFLQNPLLGGRLVNVFFGFITALLLTRIVSQFSKSRLVQLSAFILYTFLPFTFFFDRMSLIDTPLTTLLSASFLFTLYWTKKPSWKYGILSGVFWGLAVLTKSSALYTIPVFIFVLIVSLIRNQKNRLKNSMQWASSAVIGLLFLFSLKVSPLFPFLFKRSSDFAYTFQEILTTPFEILSVNVLRITPWLWQYLNPVLLLFLLTTIIVAVSKKDYSLLKRISFFLICSIIYTAPFILSGKLLTSRYFLPIIIWFIPAVSLAFEYILKKSQLLSLLAFMSALAISLSFMKPLYINLDRTLLTNDDKKQYLADWSAGFGIIEVRNYLIGRVESGKRVMVVTEGYFGTLPDGLFINFSNTSWLKNMEIFGIGQPIFNIPDEVKTKQKLYDETYLVVNQNRFQTDQKACCELIEAFPKPDNGSPLLLLKLKP